MGDKVLWGWVGITFPTAASPRSTSFTLLLGFGAELVSVIVDVCVGDFVEEGAGGGGDEERALGKGNCRVAGKRRFRKRGRSERG